MRPIFSEGRIEVIKGRHLSYAAQLLDAEQNPQKHNIDSVQIALDAVLPTDLHVL